MVGLTSITAVICACMKDTHVWLNPFTSLLVYLIVQFNYFCPTSTLNCHCSLGIFICITYYRVPYQQDSKNYAEAGAACGIYEIMCFSQIYIFYLSLSIFSMSALLSASSLSWNCSFSRVTENTSRSWSDAFSFCKVWHSAVVAESCLTRSILTCYRLLRVTYKLDLRSCRMWAIFLVAFCVTLNSTIMLLRRPPSRLDSHGDARSYIGCIVSWAIYLCQGRIYTSLLVSILLCLQDEIQ